MRLGKGEERFVTSVISWSISDLFNIHNCRLPEVARAKL